MGLLLNCNTDKGVPLMRKYLPTIIRMNEAGWQPVTLARANDDNIGIERWGGSSEKAAYFSVMNLSRTPITSEISIDIKGIGLTRSPRVVDDVSGESIDAHEDDGMLKLQLSLEAESSRVLRVSSQ
jgi:hypothetical protein